VYGSLPEFHPLKKDPSDILTDSMLNQITYYLPSLVKMREWKLLYNINTDGVSFNTFYASTRHRDNTVLLVKDQSGRVFGFYSCEEWHRGLYFYGMGESFVFTFPASHSPSQDEPPVIQVYRYTGANEQIQFSDDRCLIVGGGASKNRGAQAAIYIGHEFTGGHSGRSETFDNPVLSQQEDFKIVDFEVWGFDSI
jgi:hypothetical protein